MRCVILILGGSEQPNLRYPKNMQLKRLIQLLQRIKNFCKQHIPGNGQLGVNIELIHFYSQSICQQLLVLLVGAQRTCLLPGYSRGGNSTIFGNPLLGFPFHFSDFFNPVTKIIFHRITPRSRLCRNSIHKIRQFMQPC